MLDNFVELREKIKDNSLKFARKSAKEIIHQYYFHYVDERSDFFYDFENQNYIESNAIIINQNEKLNQISDSKYLIISFKRTIFLILITSLNLIKNFFSTKKDLKICFLSNTKDIFDININIKYKEIELEKTFLEEIDNLNELFRIHQQLNDSFKEFWKIIKTSITSFLIKQSYKSIKNQIHTRFFASKFLAPETDTDNFTNKCDIYSFGKMIYYMITEKEPQQNNANEKDDFNENLELFEIYKKCINEDEKKRPTSDELIEYFYKLFNLRINFNNLLQGCEDHLTNFLNFNKFVAIKSISYRKDSHSQYMMSIVYRNQQFLEPNFQKTIYYLTLAADQNHTEAQYDLGFLYYEKLNNVNKSIYYLTLAANKNHKLAQFKLGMIYLSKKYINQDISRSIYYFTLAAKQNMDAAQFNLGAIYSCKGVKCYDVNKAIYYFKLASNNNNTLANDHLGSIYYSNDHSLHDINKAIYYFSLGAKQNSPYSQFFLGEIYYNGKYVLCDIKQSIFYLKLAASQNYSYALNLLGDIYYDGICVPKNITIAIDYYSRAVKLNSADSMNNLGYIFLNDQYDINKAIYYFELASIQNYAESQFNLGVIYHYNKKNRDIKKAVFYYNLVYNIIRLNKANFAK